MSDKKPYDVAKFCAMCNQTIWEEIYYQCETCKSIKYFLCSACEGMGKFRFHADGNHKLLAFPANPIAVSKPKRVERVFDNCRELRLRGLSGDR